MTGAHTSPWLHREERNKSDRLKQKTDWNRVLLVEGVRAPVTWSTEDRINVIVVCLSTRQNASDKLHVAQE